MKININTALLIAVLSSTTSYAEDATQNGEIQPIVAAEKAPVKFDIDYMDNGVRVVIPKALPQIKLAQGEMIINKGGTPDVVYKIKDGYVNAGFNAEMNALWRSGHTFMQIKAFAGSAQDLSNLKENFSKAEGVSNGIALFRNLLGAAVGFTVGSAIGGVEGGLRGAEGGIFGDKRISGVVNAKPALFDGSESLEVVGDEYIVIYAVKTDDKNEGVVAFVTDQASIDDDIVIRGIMKAHNFSK